MAYYRPEDIERLIRAWQRIPGRQQKLTERLVNRTYRTPRAKEFALHGFGRRFSTLKECIDIVFRSLPPESESIPGDEERALATIAIHSYLINVFGCADNLRYQRSDATPLAGKKDGR